MHHNLNKEADVIPAHLEPTSISFESFFEIYETCAELKRQNYKKVALQFPDDLLWAAVRVSSELNRQTGVFCYVLGDSSYSPCCIDEVAAQHSQPDAIVHYGRSCLSPASRFPYLLVFGKKPVDISRLSQSIEKFAAEHKDSQVLVLFETSYYYAASQISPTPSHVHLCRIPLRSTAKALISESSRVFGRVFPEVREEQLTNAVLLWIGASDSPTLTNVLMKFSQQRVFSCDPLGGQTKQESGTANKTLMRRYYLVNAARDVNVFGIVVGTLAIANYLEVISYLKKIIREAGKRFYVFVVGKVNAAKLANFQEIDMFVLVACPESVLLDSKDFYKPIVTPAEVEMALVPGKGWTGRYTADFRELLKSLSGENPQTPALEQDEDEREGVRFSLVSRSIQPLYRPAADSTTTSVPAGPDEFAEQRLMVRDSGGALAVAPRSAAEFLSSKRSYRGLDPQLGASTPVEKAKPGRAGIAIEYEEEPKSS